jgi:hypothetical protein
MSKDSFLVLKSVYTSHENRNKWFKVIRRTVVNYWQEAMIIAN